MGFVMVMAALAQIVLVLLMEMLGKMIAVFVVVITAAAQIVLVLLMEMLRKMTVVFVMVMAALAQIVLVLLMEMLRKMIVVFVMVMVQVAQQLLQQNLYVKISTRKNYVRKKPRKLGLTVLGKKLLAHVHLPKDGYHHVRTTMVIKNPARKLDANGKRKLMSA